MPRGNVAEHRAPIGVVTDKPVYIRLRPEELQKFKARAATEGRSLGNMDRVLILSALAHQACFPSVEVSRCPLRNIA